MTRKSARHTWMRLLWYWNSDANHRTHTAKDSNVHAIKLILAFASCWAIEHISVADQQLLGVTVPRYGCSMFWWQEINLRPKADAVDLVSAILGERNPSKSKWRDLQANGRLTISIGSEFVAFQAHRAELSWRGCLTSLLEGMAHVLPTPDTWFTVMAT